MIDLWSQNSLLTLPPHFLDYARNDNAQGRSPGVEKFLQDGLVIQQICYRFCNLYCIRQHSSFKHRV